MNLKIEGFRYAVLAAAIATALHSPQALSNVLEEIVVTAQKRQQDPQDIPVAIDVFAGESMEEKGVLHLGSLEHISPSFSISEGTSSANLFIRGIGSNVAGTGNYGSVAVYIDGAYQARPNSIVVGAGSLENLESLQLLKGPQGSLYGRNSTGGALVLTTKKPLPGEEFSGSVKATLGNFGQQKYSVDLNGSLSDTLAASIGYSSNDNDGYVENLNHALRSSDLDDADGFQVRAKLVFQPNEDTDITLSARYNEDLSGVLGMQQLGHTDDELGQFGLDNVRTFWVGTLLGGILPAFGVDVTNPAIAGQVIQAASQLRFTDKPGTTYDNGMSPQAQGVIDDDGVLGNLGNGGYYEDTNIGLNATFSYADFDLVSISHYNDHRDSSAADIFRVDPLSVPDLTSISPAIALLDLTSVGFGADFNSKAYSQELYLVSTDSDIEWITGLYYFHEEGTSEIAGGAFGFNALTTDNTWDNESAAVYGEVNIPFADAFVATIGGRYTRGENNIDEDLPASSVDKLSQSANQFTYNLKLAYYTDNWLYYGGVSTGFKSGSLNPSDPSAGQVDPEEITSIEVGFKGELLDGSARVNGAFFNYDYANIQLNVVQPGGTGSVVLVDGAEAEVTGLELGIEALVGGNTTLFASTTLLDHEYANNPPNAATPIEGNSLSLTADAVLVVGGNHTLDLAKGATLRFNASVSHNSGFWINQANTYGSGGDDDSGYTTANTSVKYTDGDGRYSVLVFANNITDEEYFRSGIDIADGLVQLGTAGRPRTYGVTASLNF